MTKANISLETRAGLNYQSILGAISGANASGFKLNSSDVVVLDAADEQSPVFLGLFSSADFIRVFNQTLLNLDFRLVWESPDGGLCEVATTTVVAGGSSNFSFPSLLSVGKIRLIETSGNPLNTGGGVRVVRTTSTFSPNSYVESFQKLITSTYKPPVLKGAYLQGAGVAFYNCSGPGITVTQVVRTPTPDNTVVVSNASVIPAGSFDVFSEEVGYDYEYQLSAVPADAYVMLSSILPLNKVDTPAFG